MKVLIAMLIAITGDSHALGHPGQELARELRELGHQVVLCGRIGATSGQAPWPMGADGVVAFLGSNETPSRAMLDRYRRLNAVVVGPPRSRLGRVELAAAALAGARLARFVDSRPCTDPRDAGDGLHYSRAGARRWARCVLPRVLELLGAR